MIEIIDKTKCAGCTACYSVCPKSAIIMEEDNEGFLYPMVNQNKCVQCNMCDDVCPYKNDKRPDYDLENCFVAINLNEKQRAKSSSGGIFVLLAESILNEGGIVYGAAFDTEWCVYHRGAESKSELDALMGSKYMQSTMGNTFSKVADELNKGRKVLFTGTTCQINGLRNFLKKDYENLYCNDFICLGVPSPKIWRDYLEIFFPRYDIKSINFKDKSLGWHMFSLNIEGSKNKFIKNGRDTYFFIGYFRHLYTRPACSKCVYKLGNRYSDITISDCWGYNKIAPEMDDNKGMSSVVCHTNRGMDLFNSIKPNIKWKEADMKDVLLYNSGYRKSVSMAYNRDEFWKDYNNIPKKKLFKKYCSPVKQNPLTKLYAKIKRFIGIK